jgi:hypothetical protein
MLQSLSLFLGGQSNENNQILNSLRINNRGNNCTIYSFAHPVFHLFSDGKKIPKGKNRDLGLKGKTLFREPKNLFENEIMN